MAPKTGSTKYQGAFGVVALGQDTEDRLTESSGSLNDVQMKRVFKTAECDEVKKSIIIVP